MTIISFGAGASRARATLARNERNPTRLSPYLCAFCVLGCLLAIPVAAQQPAMTPADRSALRRALIDADAGRSQQAEPVLTRLAARYPANDQADEALGLLYAESGDFSRSLPLLERACRSAPRSALDHANLGTAWLKLGHPREAAAQLKLAARLDPHNAATFSALGQASMALQDPAAGAQAFAQASALDPHNADLLYNWAVALADQSESQRALNVLNRIPEAEMSDQAESLAGDLNEKLGHFVQAARHDQRAAEINPSEANLYALCVEFLRHWTWDSAEKTAAYGVGKYPASVRLKLAQAVAFFGASKYSDSAKLFAELLQHDPDSDEDAEMLGRVCSEMPGANPECGALRSFAEQHPSNAAAAVYAAQQILDSPHSEAELTEAAQLLARATSADPQSADAWYQRGLLEAQRAQWKSSAEMLQKAIALRPDFAAAHYQLANAWGHLGLLNERKRELALFQSSSRQQKTQLDSRVHDMTVFLTKQQ